ncbi:hypothetical protein DFR58_11477 [Anaerobacterium chartisolvens]|uniref:Uncharacterized protein n=1 Tax=Anaerobacterium chartisolvens TaxID=1297424 RepID=A0A369B0A0_9FIRM|nr:hypothetical protein [Anaerobacterium chartisolvens]RCX14843.1 hypothetical protein DFR58_11477 [Anaerobacterium chartisolvens]
MQPKKIIFIGKDGTTRLECRLSSLPLNEEKVIEKSIELFNDCEPCIIHRSFAVKKLLLKIEEYFNKMLADGNRQIFWGDVPPDIRALLRLSEDVATLRLDL